MRISLITSFLMLVFVLPQALVAQAEKVHNQKLGVRYAYGFIFPHSPTIEYLANRSTNQQEFFWEWQTSGQKEWYSWYENPGIGVAFSHYGLNNEQQLGSAYSLSGHFNFRMFGNETFGIRFRPSLGLGYIEKIFDRRENFKNAAIGSKINMFLGILGEANWQINERLAISSGLSLSHMSNTAFQTPNLGINIVAITSNVSYRFGSISEIQSYTRESFEKPKAHWQISHGLGINEINPPNGKKYLAQALFISREKRIGYRSSIGFGTDIFYNPAQREFLKGLGENITAIENMQIALSVSHVLHFGRLSFTGQLSYYVKSENEELGKIYHVFGGRGQLTDRLNAFIAGKTHIDKAEYFLIGFGYKLGGDEK